MVEQRYPFNITATLPPYWTERRLEIAVYDWKVRINREFLGHHWARQEGNQMDGIVVFERKPFPHAHMMLVPPNGKRSWDHFFLLAPMWFAPPFESELAHLFPKPVTKDGKMYIQRIQQTDADFRRVGSYNFKEIEWFMDAAERWKFIRQLEGRQVLLAK